MQQNLTLEKLEIAKRADKPAPNPKLRGTEKKNELEDTPARNLYKRFKGDRCTSMDSITDFKELKGEKKKVLKLKLHYLNGVGQVQVDPANKVIKKLISKNERFQMELDNSK